MINEAEVTEALESTRSVTRGFKTAGEYPWEMARVLGAEVQRIRDLRLELEDLLGRSERDVDRMRRFKPPEECREGDLFIDCTWEEIHRSLRAIIDRLPPTSR